MRFPSLKQIAAPYIFQWWQKVTARYEQDFQALSGSQALAIVAAGTTQADAAPLGSTVNQIVTAAANSGVLLQPTPNVVQPIVVANMGAHTLKVYPQPAGQINALGTNNPFSVPAGRVFVCWYASAVQVYGGLLS